VYIHYVECSVLLASVCTRETVRMPWQSYDTTERADHCNPHGGSVYKGDGRRDTGI